MYITSSMFGMWQKVSPKNSQKRPRGKNVVNFPLDQVTCEGDKNLLHEKWISIVHHSANIHSWDSADLYHECPHPPIPREEARTKRWFHPGSPAHEALREVVFDKTLLKDIEKLMLNCHTETLEVYHSVQPKYLSKRQHF